MTTSTIPKKETKPRYTFRQIIEGLEGVLIIIAGYLTFFLKPLRDYWGISKKEANKIFPGDEIIPKPKVHFTHAITINAPPAYVWPWIAQIGQGRGGFYSYEALENLIGLNIYNSDKILPTYQQPKIGDLVPFSPEFAIPIAICHPGQYMAIENCFDLDAQKIIDPKLTTPKNYLHLSWLWKVETLEENRSRFISRNRVTYSPSFKSNLMFGSFSEPIVFAMDRKMCLGIKKRAERMFKGEKNNLKTQQ